MSPLAPLGRLPSLVGTFREFLKNTLRLVQIKAEILNGQTPYSFKEAAEETAHHGEIKLLPQCGKGE